MVSGALFGCFPLHRYFCNFVIFLCNLLLFLDLEKTVINLEPLHLKSVQNSKRWTPNIIEKSNNRSSIAP